ncbi:YbhB/YbcL family Raf kinase inhibitor-like protein [Sneathiella chinensis]|uniref:Phosphatidylethanolamine-binding protein n=1 Tax=Sneathiella chinensis TaxID=349750 RepID=A0ABQ5U042_9PROT|nr:YbhB/YbcL family Raf kinase inhibitor-like protein [Sneathiella chinensis]GLQ05582.1 phosphatidylethanolamine-binding protein [Sneathiella chinensis]
MTATLNVTIEGWEDGAPIPAKFSFGKPAATGHVELSDNLNPAISWSGAPEGTRSFAIICHDPDVPSAGDDVNQEGKTVPASLPRVDFYHWVLVDIDASRTQIAEGEDSNGITPKGKAPGKQAHGTTGINNYTDWFAGDADMGGNYGGYDGPCPPWNDSIKHHYVFTVYALDVDTLGLTGNFGGPEALAAMQGHILAQGTCVGTYSLNPEVPA